MFTSIVLGFYALFFLSLSFTIYLYIRLVVAIRQGKDVPNGFINLAMLFKEEFTLTMKKSQMLMPLKRFIGSC